MNVIKNKTFSLAWSRIRTLLLIFLASGIFVMFFTACKREPSTVMRIGTDIWPGYEPLFLARHEGRLSEEQFRLVEFSDSSAVGRAFRNHTIEAACLTMDEVFYLLQDKMDPVILLVLDQSNGADVLLAHPEIKNLHGLKGKRVGVEVSAVETYTLTRALQSAGMTITDILPVYMPMEKHLEAFQSGSVDAVVTFEPTRTKLLAQGAVDLFNSSMIPGEIVDVLVIRRDYLEEHPDQAETVKQAWFKALEQLRQSPEASAKVMAIREQVTADEFTASLRGLNFPGEQENHKLLEGNPPALLESAERLKTVMRNAGLLRQDIAIKSIFTITNIASPKSPP